MPDAHTTTTAPSETRTCVVDGWRDLPKGRPAVCHPCEKRMTGQLGFLASALGLLRAIARNEPTPSGELDLNAVDLTLAARTTYRGLDDDLDGCSPIATTLGRWHTYWTSLPVDGRQPSRLIAGIIERLPWACTVYGPSMDAFAADLHHLYSQTRATVHADVRPTRYAAPCPNCWTLTLVREIGADWITCTSSDCHLRWDEDDYQTMALAEIPDTAQLTAHQVATLTGVDPGTIRQLVFRGRLIPCNPDAVDEHPRYTRAHVEQVMAEVELFRANAGVLAVHRPGYTEMLKLPAGTWVQIAGCVIRLRRGKTVEIGPVGPGVKHTIVTPTRREMVEA